MEVSYSYLAEKVEVLWKFCGCEISIKTATTVTFEMAHFDWTRFSLPFAGRSDFEWCINHIYVQMLIVLFAKTYFRTWLWETFSCGVWLTNIWSLDSLHFSLLALDFHKHGVSQSLFSDRFLRKFMWSMIEKHCSSWQLLALHTSGPSQAWWTDCEPISIFQLHSGKIDLEFD